jgi:hypothetical protein
MRKELLHAAGSVLGRVVSIGDELLGYLRLLAEFLEKTALREGHAVECPYCQEHIRTVEDHVMWCDVVEMLKAPLADSATAWPITRYGIAINKNWAEALTRTSRGN